MPENFEGIDTTIDPNHQNTNIFAFGKDHEQINQLQAGVFIHRPSITRLPGFQGNHFALRYMVYNGGQLIDIVITPVINYRNTTTSFRNQFHTLFGRNIINVLNNQMAEVSFIAIGNLFKKGIMNGQTLHILFINSSNDELILDVPQYINEITQLDPFPNHLISNPLLPINPLLGEIIHFPYENVVEFKCIIPRGIVYRVLFQYINPIRVISVVENFIIG